MDCSDTNGWVAFLYLSGLSRISSCDIRASSREVQCGDLAPENVYKVCIQNYRTRGPALRLQFTQIPVLILYSLLIFR